MWELANAVVLTRSGLTRLVERLEREGLVERCRAEDDARRVYAQITRRGRKRLEEASATHVAGIRRLFLERLSPDQVEMLAGAWRQLLE
jgi:DNA-binding MarR family transcriptional regulator